MHVHPAEAVGTNACTDYQQTTEIDDKSCTAGPP